MARAPQRPSQAEAAAGRPASPSEEASAARLLVRTERKAPEPRPAPRPGHVWVEGYWHWNGVREVWVAGHWEKAGGGLLWR